MGQYYHVFLEQNKKTTIFNRDVDGEYTMAKLMEHSWWKNPFVASFTKLLYKEPSRVIWMGDYADDDSHCQKLSSDFERNFFKEIYGDGVEEKDIKEDVLLLDDKYLVNHTKNVYIDCNSYKEKALNDGWTIHPLPLLTALGNGQGGGDYFSRVHKEDVGTWAFDEISVEDTIPEGYDVVDIYFKEE